jgi:two-component sensor histidine kinase
MPPINEQDMAAIPSGLSIHEMISNAAKFALEDRYGSLAECAQW